jgi:hypothetical protein
MSTLLPPRKSKGWSSKSRRFIAEAELANGCPLTIDHLMDDLIRVAQSTRRSSQLLQGFIHGSNLPPFLSS